MFTVAGAVRRGLQAAGFEVEKRFWIEAARSHTAIWYASQNGSVYVRSKSLWSPKWMLEELAVELGLTPAKHKKDLFMGVMEELRQRPRLVIIDESNMPPSTCLDAIRDLHDLTTLIGERDEVTDSTTVGDHGSRSAQRSIRRVPIMPPDTIRTLPFGTALVLLRSAPPIVTRMRTWLDRPDAKELRADRAGIEALLQRRPLEEPGAPA